MMPARDMNMIDVDRCLDIVGLDLVSATNYKQVVPVVITGLHSYLQRPENICCDGRGIYDRVRATLEQRNIPADYINDKLGGLGCRQSTPEPVLEPASQKPKRSRIDDIYDKSGIDAVNDINYELALPEALRRLKAGMFGAHLSRGEKATLRIRAREALIGQCLNESYIDELLAQELGIDDLTRAVIEVDGEITLTRMNDIAVRPIKWLWPDRIARGAITVVAGPPDGGKTTLAMGLAATISVGGRWPDGGRAEKGTVLILSAEDDPARTLKPRFLASGGNPSNAAIIDAVKTSEKKRPFNLATDVDHLLTLCECERPSLIIIDPISAYLGRVDSHKNAEVRAALTPLADMAIKADVSILLISHLNKGGADQDALSRITGSLAFVAAARSVYLVTLDKQDSGKKRRLFLPIKNNLSPVRTGLAFSIEGVPVRGEMDGGDTIGTRPVWEPDPIDDLSAEDALRFGRDNATPESLIAYIERKGGRVTPRDLRRTGRFTTTEDAEVAIRGLVASGYGHIEEKPSSSRGGRPTIRFVRSDTTDTTDVTDITAKTDETPLTPGVLEVSSVLSVLAVTAVDRGVTDETPLTPTQANDEV